MTNINSLNNFFSLLLSGTSSGNRTAKTEDSYSFFSTNNTVVDNKKEVQNTDIEKSIENLSAQFGKFLSSLLQFASGVLTNLSVALQNTSKKGNQTCSGTTTSSPTYNTGSYLGDYQQPQLSNLGNQTVETTATKNIDSKLAQSLDKKLGSGFSAKLEQVSANIGCNPNDLLGLMYSECGLKPNSQNSCGATGLIQFLPKTAEGLGTSTSALKNMSAIDQLDYVEKFFTKNKKTYLGSSNAQLDAGTLYALCFLPAYSKKDVLCTSSSKYYKWNKGLDLNKDGQITKSDLSNRVANKYQEMYKHFA